MATTRTKAKLGHLSCSPFIWRSGQSWARGVPWLEVEVGWIRFTHMSLHIIPNAVGRQAILRQALERDWTILRSSVILGIDNTVHSPVFVRNWKLDTYLRKCRNPLVDRHRFQSRDKEEAWPVTRVGGGFVGLADLQDTIQGQIFPKSSSSTLRCMLESQRPTINLSRMRRSLRQLMCPQLWPQWRRPLYLMWLSYSHICESMNKFSNLSVDNSNRAKKNSSVKKCRAQTEHKLTKQRAKRWRKWWPATFATNPGYTAFMFFPRWWHVVMGTAITGILRCVARHSDCSVRNGRLMTRHKQSFKAHGHTCNSSRFKILMSPHEFLMRTRECSWVSSGGKNASWLFFVRVGVLASA